MTGKDMRLLIDTNRYADMDAGGPDVVRRLDTRDDHFTHVPGLKLYSG